MFLNELTGPIVAVASLIAVTIILLLNNHQMNKDKQKWFGIGMNTQKLIHNKKGA